MKKLLYTSLLTAAIPATFFGCNQTTVQDVTLANQEFCLTDTLASMITTHKASLQEVENVLQLSGKVTFDEKQVYHIYPQVGGYVQQVKVELGDYVKKGETLAIIKSGEVAEFEQEYSQAQSNLSVAVKNLDVATDMFTAGLISEKDLLAAQQEKKNADAAYRRMKEIFSIYSIGKNSEYIVKAPASGFIVEKNVNADMQIRPDNADNIFTISSMNEVWILANVYESDIAKVKEGYEADVTTLSYPDKVYKGKIDKIFNVLDPATRVMKVRVRLENTGFELKPEMFANVMVRSTENRQLIAVPTESVIFDQSKNYVMAFRKRCEVDTRRVEIYKTIGPVTYLKSGLKDGEMVITKYPLLVFDARKSN